MCVCIYVYIHTHIYILFFFCRGLGNQRSNVVSFVRHIRRHMMSVHVLLTNVNFDLLIEMISPIADFTLQPSLIFAWVSVAMMCAKCWVCNSILSVIISWHFTLRKSFPLLPFYLSFSVFLSVWAHVFLCDSVGYNPLLSFFILMFNLSVKSFKQGHESHFERLPWLQCGGAQRHRNQWGGSPVGLGKWFGPEPGSGDDKVLSRSPRLLEPRADLPIYNLTPPCHLSWTHADLTSLI